jgi:hypothetical protein
MAATRITIITINAAVLEMPDILRLGGSSKILTLNACVVVVVIKALAA